MRVRIHQGTKEIGGTCVEVDLQRSTKALWGLTDLLDNYWSDSQIRGD